MAKNGEWQIVVGERPLGALGRWDEFFLGGREFSHSFIALVDPNGNVVEELHGQSYDIENSKPSDMSLDLASIVNVAFSRPGALVSTGTKNKLKVQLRDGVSDPEKTEYTPMVSGDKADIMTRWRAAMENAAHINELDIDYIAIGVDPEKRAGQNCHSATCNMLMAAGVKARELNKLNDNRFLRPGFKRDLAFRKFKKSTQGGFRLMPDEILRNVLETVANLTSIAEIKRKLMGSTSTTAIGHAMAEGFSRFMKDTLEGSVLDLSRFTNNTPPVEPKIIMPPAAEKPKAAEPKAAAPKAKTPVQRQRRKRHAAPTA